MQYIKYNYFNNYITSCQYNKKVIFNAYHIIYFQERHQARKKKLYYAFVDREKTFDTVSREMVIFMALYTEACNVIRTDSRLRKRFEGKLGLHQGSVLSPVLFVVVLDDGCSEARSALPSELLYADDLVLMAHAM